MPSPFPLQTVLELMQSRTDQAAIELGLRITSERDAKAQLRLLENYRHEYAERFRGAAQDGMTPLQWQNYQEFMSKLDAAIGQQSAIVAGTEAETAAGQTKWLNQKNRQRALDTLAVRHFDRERISEGRREQKTTDEIAARRHTDPTP